MDRVDTRNIHLRTPVKDSLVRQKFCTKIVHDDRSITIFAIYHSKEHRQVFRYHGVDERAINSVSSRGVGCMFGFLVVDIYPIGVDDLHCKSAEFALWVGFKYMGAIAS